MKKTVFIIMILTAISQIFGFAKGLTLAYFYGTSSISDVYLVTLTITGVLFIVIATGISTGYIPLLSDLIQNVNSHEGLRFTNNLINLLLVFSTIVIVLGIIFAEVIIKIVFSGFDQNSLSMAILFTRISFTSIYFTIMIRIFKAFLQVYDSFFISTMIGIPVSMVVIVSIALSYSSNVVVIIIGYVLATFIQFLILLMHAYRKGYRYKFVLDLKDKNIRKIIIIAIPVIIGTSVEQINTVVDRSIASHISIGGISALEYANALNGFVLAVVVASIYTVLFPLLSKKAANSDIVGLKLVLSDVIIGLMVLVIPATIGFITLSEQIVTMLYGRGAFDKEAIIMTANALFYYSIGLIGYALRDVVISVFYSLHDSKTPMINAAIAMVMNIILNIILSKYMGISGLALATSISAILCTALLIRSLKLKIGSLGFKNILVAFIKIIIASIIMGFIVKVLFSFLLLYINSNFSLIVAITISALSYFIFIYFMNIKEVNIIVISFKGKLFSK
ncbi:murein biosynthesis integral membrane protein MurJ [Planococcus sp. N028]|uniref:Probable lipid II flippase MurJ n=1 Tax=Planococcus shixiaomingii TaxID=3058393 RepID=A0ABT8N1C0_9BACL|nr:murein biosynthesis integral membrane protein MurJ [Planococcus sp. N028]MDN7241680.1 murein biosynthesis integral membrane protein MurJ [Planococcus sp. N028]